jgi:hypothetical protein
VSVGNLRKLSKVSDEEREEGGSFDIEKDLKRHNSVLLKKGIDS